MIKKDLKKLQKNQWIIKTDDRVRAYP
jgi:hypothetical protein